MRYLTLESKELIQEGDKEVVFVEGLSGVCIPEVPIEKVGTSADGFLILRPVKIPTFEEVSQARIESCDFEGIAACEDTNRSCGLCLYNAMLKLIGVEK